MHQIKRIFTATCALCLASTAWAAGPKKKPTPKPPVVAPPASAPAAAEPPAAAGDVAVAPAAGDAPAAPAPAPAAPVNKQEQALNELMGPYRWGMTIDETMSTLEKVVGERYAEQMKRTTDVYVQNRLRKQIKDDVDVVRATYVAFEGQKSGWDVSIIEGEFLQKNDESMVTYREVDPATKKDQSRFFFFYQGKLWKMFVAFNMEQYKGKTFKDFKDAMESRYGAGTPVVKKVASDGKEHLVGVTWSRGGTLLRALDLFQFYANFCLALSDENIEAVMRPLRESRAPKAGTPKGTVSDGGGNTAPPVPDPNSNIIDQITGDKPAPAPSK